MRTSCRRGQSQRLPGRVLAAALVAAVLTGCSGVERVEWPGARFVLPDGWEVVSEDRQRLVLADHETTTQDRGVLVTFFRVPGTVPADWRQRIAERGALLESDAGILIAGDVPATQLVLLDEIDGTPFREVLLVVASRELVISITPRVPPGDQTGPSVLLEGLDAVRELLDDIELTLSTFS